MTSLALLYKYNTRLKYQQNQSPTRGKKSIIENMCSVFKYKLPLWKLFVETAYLTMLVTRSKFVFPPTEPRSRAGSLLPDMLISVNAVKKSDIQCSGCTGCCRWTVWGKYSAMPHFVPNITDPYLDEALLATTTYDTTISWGSGFKATGYCYEKTASLTRIEFVDFKW